MFHRFYKSYVTFFDETIENSTCIVMLIASIICSVGFIVPTQHVSATDIPKSYIVEIAPNSEILSHLGGNILGSSQIGLIKNTK